MLTPGCSTLPVPLVVPAPCHGFFLTPVAEQSCLGWCKHSPAGNKAWPTVEQERTTLAALHCTHTYSFGTIAARGSCFPAPCAFGKGQREQAWIKASLQGTKETQVTGENKINLETHPACGELRADGLLAALIHPEQVPLLSHSHSAL